MFLYYTASFTKKHKHAFSLCLILHVLKIKGKYFFCCTSCLTCNSPAPSPGGKSQRHELAPEPDEEDDTSQEDFIISLAWDPLSLDYLLVANLLSGVRLVDSVSLSVIMVFQLPSAAARVKTLAWVHTAPGMFITGGESLVLTLMLDLSDSYQMVSIQD